jgi:hypothetical protein
MTITQKVTEDSATATIVDGRIRYTLAVEVVRGIKTVCLRVDEGNGSTGQVYVADVAGATGRRDGYSAGLTTAHQVA